MRLGASRPITEVGVKSELVALKRCDGIRAAELAFQCSVKAPSMRVGAPFTNSASAHNCERVCRAVALPAPDDRERTQWYFQRYVPHLPAAGEIVLFDRSHAVDKKRARLNCIHHLLEQFPYQEVIKPAYVLPAREHHEHYSRQAVSDEMLVSEVYSAPAMAERGD
jgi:Polyphosphate kinase 2 (PPK2)